MKLRPKITKIASRGPAPPWRRKSVEKWHLVPSNLAFLLIAIDRNGFRTVKEEGQIYKNIASEFLISALGQTTLSTKSRWRFRTKRRSKEIFDHTRLCTFRFHINRLVTVRQSKTRTTIGYRSRAARLENDEITKRVFLHPLRSLIYDVRFHESCLDDFHDTVRKRG